MIALSDVKAAMGITDDSLDAMITPYFYDVIDYIKGAGVAEKNITPALVARGISDIWNYGAAGGEYSKSFNQRVTQLAFKK